MRSIIGIIAVITGIIFGGNFLLKETHDSVKKASLKKVKKGLPSLVEMSEKLTGEKTILDNDKYKVIKLDSNK